MKSMKDKYGSEKGKEVFYASKNKGKIKGVDKGSDKMNKVTCPKCKGKGCSHCGGKGYHMKKGYAAGGLKSVPKGNKGLGKLPQDVRNKMGFMNKGGMAKKKKGYALGGPTTPMEGEQSRYRPSANRAPQGMMSARGMTSGMGMNKGGMSKKRSGYAHGGMAKCGASNPGTQKRGKK